MKELISLIISSTIVVIMGVAAYCYINKEEAVTKDEFMQYEKEFHIEIDSIKRKLDKMDISLDTLKTGQKVIYIEIKKDRKARSSWNPFN